jgi:hypothetical protein
MHDAAAEHLHAWELLRTLSKQAATPATEGVAGSAPGRDLLEDPKISASSADTCKPCPRYVPALGCLPSSNRGMAT